MNVLIPAAGFGTRLKKAGYKKPKPLVDIEGTPMIVQAVRSLDLDARHIFVVQRCHYEMGLRECLEKERPDCFIICIDGLTDGAADTTLLAKHLINNGDPLVVADCDFVLHYNSKKFQEFLPTTDGCTITYETNGDQYSYVLTDESGKIVLVREKECISNMANVGVYGWGKGSEYVWCAEELVRRDIRCKGEHYVSLVYNIGIEEGMTFYPFPSEDIWYVGIPEELQKYLER